MAHLLEDFRSSRPDLESRVELARRMAEGTRGFLQLVNEGAPGETLAVPDPLVLAALGGPTYEPATNTLDVAPYFDKVSAWSGGRPLRRRFYVEFAAADFEELLSSLDRSADLLQRQLGH